MAFSGRQAHCFKFVWTFGVPLFPHCPLVCVCVCVCLSVCEVQVSVVVFVVGGILRSRHKSFSSMCLLAACVQELSCFKCAPGKGGEGWEGMGWVYVYMSLC